MEMPVVTDSASASLMIDQFDGSQTGDYDCLVVNPVGSVLSEVLRLEPDGAFILNVCA